MDISPADTLINYTKALDQVTGGDENVISFKIATDELNLGQVNSIALESLSLELEDDAISFVPSGKNGLCFYIQHQANGEFAKTWDDPTLTPPAWYTADNEDPPELKEPKSKRRKKECHCKIARLRHPGVNVICHRDIRETQGYEDSQFGYHAVIVDLTPEDIAAITYDFENPDGQNDFGHPYPDNPPNRARIFQARATIQSGLMLAQEIMRAHYDWQYFFDSLAENDNNTTFLQNWEAGVTMGDELSEFPHFNIRSSKFDDEEPGSGWEFSNKRMGFRFVGGTNFEEQNTILNGMNQSSFISDSVGPVGFTYNFGTFPNETTPWYQVRCLPMFSKPLMDYWFKGRLSGENVTPMEPPVGNIVWAFPYKKLVTVADYQLALDLTHVNFDKYYFGSDLYTGSAGFFSPWFWGGQDKAAHWTIRHAMCGPDPLNYTVPPRDLMLLQFRLLNPKIRGSFSNVRVADTERSVPSPIEIYLTKEPGTFFGVTCRNVDNKTYITYDSDKRYWSSLPLNLERDQRIEFAVKAIDKYGFISDVKLNRLNNVVFARFVLAEKWNN